MGGQPFHDGLESVLEKFFDDHDAPGHLFIRLALDLHHVPGQFQQPFALFFPGVVPLVEIDLAPGRSLRPVVSY